MDDVRLELLWIPLGAGGPAIVRWSGIAYEWLAARRTNRPRLDLYHAALKVHLAEHTYAIEVAPAWGPGTVHGPVAEGPVGARWLGAVRFFRYQIRVSAGGVIPDEQWAVGEPPHIDTDAARAGRLLDLVPLVPRLVWGRDQLELGEMWDSNSVVAWLLEASRHDSAPTGLPETGRAPGWQAGRSAARGTVRAPATADGNVRHPRRAPLHR